MDLRYIVSYRDTRTSYIYDQGETDCELVTENFEEANNKFDHLISNLGVWEEIKEDNPLAEEYLGVPDYYSDDPEEYECCYQKVLRYARLKHKRGYNEVWLREEDYDDERESLEGPWSAC